MFEPWLGQSPTGGAMSRQLQLKALLVVLLGGGALVSGPRDAEAGAFECGFAECIVTETCPDMEVFCALHNCYEPYTSNCGELFNCSGNKRLHYCGSGPET